MAFVTTRPVTLAGHRFARGEMVSSEALRAIDSLKLHQLVSLRILQSTASATPHVQATRTMTIGDRTYQRGEPVDVSGLSAAKVAQLLELRHVQPGAVIPVSVAAAVADPDLESEPGEAPTPRKYGKGRR